MTDNRIWLGGLLAVQLALAAGLFWSQQQAGKVAPEAPLMTAAAEAVDRILIEDNAQRVELLRTAAGWTLSGSDLPADSAKIDTVLERLASTVTGWPVTTSDAAHGRFEVDRDGFQRHLQVSVGGSAVADVFLGTSPGFRTSHLRRAGEDAVYVVGLNTFDLPAGIDGWLDRNLLAVVGADTIEGPDYTLSRDGDLWQLADALEDGRALDSERAASLASALEGLRVQGIADDNVELPEEASLVIVAESGDTRHRLEFFESDQSYYVRRDDHGQLFRISQYDYDRIAGVDGASLVLTEVEETPDSEADVPGSEAAQG